MEKENHLVVESVVVDVVVVDFVVYIEDYVDVDVCHYEAWSG